jgi:hypothetical protein
VPAFGSDGFSHDFAGRVEDLRAAYQPRAHRPLWRGEELAGRRGTLVRASHPTAGTRPVRSVALRRRGDGRAVHLPAARPAMRVASVMYGRVEATFR